MTAPATGLFKRVAFKAETTFATAAGASGAQTLRRTASTIAADAAFFKSAEINTDRQLRDARKGFKGIKGDIDGELSPGTYSAFMAAVIGSAGFAAGATTTALTNVTAAAGPPGTFTRATGSYLTDGLKVGDIGRWAGWTTGTSAANNARNYRIASLTATVMTVGTAATGASGQPEAVVAQASGDSVTFTVVGKKAITPTTGLADGSFSIEHWHSDVSQSELFIGCKPTSLDINIPSTGMATVKFGFMGVDMTPGSSAYFTTPGALTTAGLTAGVNGKLSVAGVDIATVTGLSIKVAGNHSVEAVVGSQLTPGVFPGTMDISGQITALFDSGTLRDYFLAETELSLNAVLTLTNAVNSDFIAFNIPRLKLTGATKDDKQGAVVQTVPFQCLLNVNGGAATTSDVTTIGIQDSLA
jgi:hypothetical protein